MVQWQKSTYSGGSDGSSCVELARAEASLLHRIDPSAGARDQ
ncbi:DUF397 domain-containing protein [Streptomyces prunicolor]|nr:DUF397 domain-containing protein [Streptomyces prunicolor]